VEVVLDREDALPYQYRMLQHGQRFWGAVCGSQVQVAIFRRVPVRFSMAAGGETWRSHAKPAVTLPMSASSVKASATQADFQFDVTYEGAAAATFVLRYLLNGSSVQVTLEDVKETPGYELLDVELPSLAAVREEEGPAWLAHGNDTGGSLADLAKAPAGRLRDSYLWNRQLTVLPVVMIGTPKAAVVLEVEAFTDTTELVVNGREPRRRAMVGTKKIYRVNGTLPWDMQIGGNTPRMSGNERTPNPLVGQTSLCVLDFIGDLDGDGTVNWLDGAKLVRRRLPVIPNHYFDDKVRYGATLDRPSLQKTTPPMTFEQAGKQIRETAALIDYSPQIFVLSGWQYTGHDSGYPAVDKVNERLGGYNGLVRLITESRQYNATVTFHDNYDDAYMSSPKWDPSIIARAPNGELWKSYDWGTGENSYIIGLAKYMRGPGVERIRDTCERYPLKDIYYLDVFSSYPTRNDWDPEHPASGVRNLFEGRFKIIEEFAKCGLVLGAEDFSYAFVGKVAFFSKGPRWAFGGPDPFGGQPIPLTPTIYRQAAVWGGGFNTFTPPARRNAEVNPLDQVIDLLWSNGSSRGRGTGSSMADMFYLAQLPWFKYHSRSAESYQRAGDRIILGLGKGSAIEIDPRSRQYSVTIDGTEIARTGSTFCQWDADRIAFYSLTDKDLSAPLPAGWDAKQLGALALSVEKAEEFPVQVLNNRVTVSVPAQWPVVVYRTGVKSRKVPPHLTATVNDSASPAGGN
jgi:hypothetical protein